MGQNVCIGIGWVSNDTNFAVWFGELVEVLCMSFENFSVFAQKVLSFHSFGSWLGTDQNGNVAVLEGNRLIAGDND